MAKTLQHRRDTTVNLASEAGAAGEIFMDTTKKTLVVMDGSTAGGFPLQKELTANVDITVGSSLAGDVLITDNIVSVLPTYSTDGYNTEIEQPLVVNGDLDVVGQLNKADGVIRVYATGTPAENAASLQAAVTAAALRTASFDTTYTFNNEPYAGLTFTNGFFNTQSYSQSSYLGIGVSGSEIAVEVVVSPGFYDFTTLPTNYLNITGNFISVVSETGQADVMITSDNAYSIQISGKYCYFSGLNAVGINNSGIKEMSDEVSSTLTFNNCHGGVNSFNLGKGKYYRCSGSNYSFGSTSSDSVPTNASGVFVECAGTYYCFGTSLIPSGSTGSVASGTFIRCRVSSGFAAGQADSATGTFEDCRSEDQGFGTYIASGIFLRCQGGQSSFGGGVGGTASGTFTNCIAGRYSWGMGSDNSGTLTGKLYYCRMFPIGGSDTSTFQTVSGSGRTYYCVDAAGNVNNQ